VRVFEHKIPSAKESRQLAAFPSHLAPGELRTTICSGSDRGRKRRC